MEMMSLTRGSLSLSCARAPLKVRSWWVFGVGFSFFLTWHRREILLHLSFFFSPATNKQEGVFGHFGPKKGKNKKDKNISLVMNEKVKRVTISDTKKQGADVSTTFLHTIQRAPIYNYRDTHTFALRTFPYSLARATREQ
jgi:hypothetical protein